MDLTTQSITPPNAQPAGSNHGEIQEQLARILSSELFTKSPQLSRFLKYCVEQTLQGHQDALKEQLLGAEVFRRSPFDPRLDPIVRVEARRLRSKLDDYYANEGASDPIIISFQRGDYIPRFVHVGSGGDKRAKPATPASIVIVEDERLVAQDLENRLRGLGYSVLGSASTGEGALESVANLHPDIVLMDIVLAGAMRGTEAARHIWNRWQIPVVYLTAFSDNVVLEDIKGSEPYGYILKPFEPKQVNAVLQLALSRRARQNVSVEVPTEPSRKEAIASALESAHISTWEWIVKNDDLTWPESVEDPSRPLLSAVESSSATFLEAIVPADRQRVAAAFTDAIRNHGRIEIAYRKTPPPTEGRWMIALGNVTTDPEGLVHCSGLEISAPPPEANGGSVISISDLEQFVVAAGHDLQEPLRTIKAYTQLLTRRSEGGPSPDSLMIHIEAGVDQMHALVSDLLAYTLLSHRSNAKPELVPLDTALDQAITNLNGAIQQTGAVITRSELPSVVGSSVHFVQLFQNLLSNAIKYRKEGSAPSITISASDQNQQHLITVRDEGQGFDPAFAESIFEPLKRLHGKNIPGTGLGLSICRRIVDSYGGRIWAESKEGEEAAIHFTLPGAPAIGPSVS